ncbi:hypothetical protein GQ600_10138 [Phytophthora cactorum]|nr:hypothetical protein GQ600_10138 [Phytophthora cactorum]
MIQLTWRTDNFKRTGIETSRRTVNTDFGDTRVYRRLRTTLADANYDSELRGISGITKIKDVTKVGAKKMQKVGEDVKNRLTSNNQFITDNLFRQYKVDKVESNLLKSTQFDEWTESVIRTYNYNDEAAHAAMVTMLATHKGDETLASMLAAAKDSRMNTTFKLREAQLNNWLAGKVRTMFTRSCNLTQNPMIC